MPPTVSLSALPYPIQRRMSSPRGGAAPRLLINHEPNHQVLTNLLAEWLCGAYASFRVSCMSVSARSCRSRSRQVAMISSNCAAGIGTPGMTSRIRRASSIKDQSIYRLMLNGQESSSEVLANLLVKRHQ